MLLLLGLLLLGAALTTAAMTAWRRRTVMAELGTVSDQWLSEHRGHGRHQSGL